MRLPLGLSASRAYIPADNPITQEKIELGRNLFFDPRLSADHTISCASCHLPEAGGTDNLPFSPGVGGLLGGRSAPTVLNRLFTREQMWDGRFESLEAQALGPIDNPIEMANTIDGAVAAIAAIPGYAPLFEAAFGAAEVTAERIAQAIATYERVLLTGDAPYDRYLAGDSEAMSASAVRGQELFEGKAMCNMCHRGMNFSAEEFRNIGVGMDAAEPDLGRYEVSRLEEDKGAFKTPTLRNVAMTAPYMHDGSEATLEDVVRYYERGGTENAHLHMDVASFELTATERADLVAFMEALTGPILNAEGPAELPR